LIFGSTVDIKSENKNVKVIECRISPQLCRDIIKNYEKN